MRFLFIFLTILSTTLMAQDYNSSYNSLKAFDKEGKYKSARDEAAKLYTLAEQAGDQDDMLKALAYRAAYTWELEEDGIDQTLRLLLQELDANRNRPVVSPVLNYLIGSGFYHYAQQNAYRLRNATAVTTDAQPTADVPLEDWTLRQLADAADKYLYAGIEQASRQRTELSSIPAIIRDATNNPKGIVLYDLLVTETMVMFAQPLLVVNNTAPAAAQEWLVPASNFVALDFSDLDEKTGTARRLKLYQEWLRYHLQTGGEGLMRADLARIEYVRLLGASNLEYLAALEALGKPYAKLRGGGIFQIKQAEVYAANSIEGVERPKVKALRILDEITDGDAAVQNSRKRLLAQINRQELRTSASQVSQAGQPILLNNTFRNISQLHYKLVKLRGAELDQFVDQRGYDVEAIEKLLKGEIVAEKKVPMPRVDDYESHSTETWLPAQAPGAYVLLTSYGARFSAENASAVNLQVSGLALLNFDDSKNQYYEVQDLQTGTARAGVKVEIRAEKDRRNNVWTTRRTLVTDDQGRFTVPDFNRQRIYMILTIGSDQLVTDDMYLYSNNRPNRNRSQSFTPLFTDRAVYRPGQTVHLYGITMLKDKRLMPKLLVDQEREVRLRDANYQEVEMKSVSSDEYGRFNLSFVLPESGLTGNFRLETEGGSISFRVEEYKRPKFEVEVTAPDYLVGGDTAEFAGKAMLFAGPAVNDAKVSYRVFVEEQRWFWWYRGPSGSDRELVEFGETTTDEAGAFTVKFTPSKELAARRVRYQYVVEVDVADDTGETHTASGSAGLRSAKPAVALNTGKKFQVGDTLTINASGSEETVVVEYRISRVEKPDANLKPRKWGFPDLPLMNEQEYKERFPQYASGPAELEQNWSVLREKVTNQKLTVAAGKGQVKLLMDDYAVGYYRIDWAYEDGTPGTPLVFEVSDLERELLPAGVLFDINRMTKEVRPGEPIQFKLVASEPLPNITYSFMSRKGVVREVTAADRTAVISYTPTDEDRGGIQFDLAFVHAGELYAKSFRLPFGWDNKKLSVDYATFRDKLRPGQPETWTLTIRNADGSPVHAAALASMYDASLDQIAPPTAWGMNLYPGIDRYRNFVSMTLTGVQSATTRSVAEDLNLQKESNIPGLDLSPLDFRQSFDGRLMRSNSMAFAKNRMEASASLSDEVVEESEFIDDSSVDIVTTNVAIPPPSAPKVEEASVSIRKNLQETAFWMPELTSNDGGDLVVSFTSPEALTKWKFRVLTHDTQLNHGYSEQEIVTQKELMVLPNVPRFLREGDALELTARVNNMTDEDLQVSVQIEYFNPETNEVINMGAAAGKEACTEKQVVGSNSDKSFCFPLTIPDGFASNGPLGYRVIARGGNFSDGEENVFPVLTDRTLITASKAFYLKKKDAKDVSIPLLATTTSSSLHHVGYTFEATTNPAWMALKSLPYLMEYPYDCTEQVANRYFANQLGYVTVSRKPVLEGVFRKWQQDSTALTSELEQNATLKNALLTETPWVRAAQSEAEQRARIAHLFELKKLAAELQSALDKLQRRQQSDGSYSWFPGGPKSRYMTQYVLETLARLKQLQAISEDQQATVTGIMVKAVTYLDNQLANDYADLKKAHKDKPEELEKYVPGSIVVHYLYARAMAVGTGSAPSQEALDFYRNRVLASYTEYQLYGQALIASMGPAIATKYPEAGTVSVKIIEALRERAIRKDEFGMYWKYGRGYRWNNLPIETHARLLEAFNSNGGTADELDEMRLWLITNKRTNRWPTTKSTAAAVFALLNTGTDWVATEGKPIKVSWPQAPKSLKLGNRVEEAFAAAEAATGSFKVNVTGPEVNPSLATVSVKNQANNLVWGGIYWQYTELATKVQASNDGPLTLERELFHRIPTDGGIRLEPISAYKPLTAGDRVTVRLILRADRELDYVHVKDRRAATFEPIEQLSGYQYKNGLGFYFAPGDLATNFFIHSLPKGTHTIEYDLFATFSGTFSNGLGRVQCMYAPEFGANTSGATIVVE